MRRPGRRRSDDDAESEDLARARRERARRARADLAAKAKGDGDEEPKGKGSEKAGAKAKDDARERQREKLAKTRKPADEAKGTESDSKSKSKSKDADDERRGSRPKATPKGKRRDRGDGTKKRKRGERKRGEGAKRGQSAKRAGVAGLKALRQGAGETGKRAKSAAPGAAQGALNLLATAFGWFFTGLGFLIGLFISAYLVVGGPARRVAGMARGGIVAASRLASPVRVLAVVVAGAALLLALSQFADYRSVSIGNNAYSEGIQTVAPAPVRETAETGSAHSYLMVPLAAVALVILGLSLRGRWRLCRLIALVGVAAIAVGIIHDRPTGLDPGDLTLAYEGVEASLLGGFYAQLFSGLLLTLSSLLLGRELRLAGARKPARASRSRRRLLRRDPRVEGARA